MEKGDPEEKLVSRDYPIEVYEPFLLGKTIKSIEYNDCDQGFKITFTDNTYFNFGFSTCEGMIEKYEN